MVMGVEWQEFYVRNRYEASFSTWRNLCRARFKCTRRFHASSKGLFLSTLDTQNISASMMPLCPLPKHVVVPPIGRSFPQSCSNPTITFITLTDIQQLLVLSTSNGARNKIIITFDFFVPSNFFFILGNRIPKLGS